MKAWILETSFHLQQEEVHSVHSFEILTSCYMCFFIVQLVNSLHCGFHIYNEGINDCNVLWSYGIIHVGNEDCLSFSIIIINVSINKYL